CAASRNGAAAVLEGAAVLDGRLLLAVDRCEIRRRRIVPVGLFCELPRPICELRVNGGVSPRACAVADLHHERRDVRPGAFSDRPLAPPAAIDRSAPAKRRAPVRLSSANTSALHLGQSPCPY